MAYTAPYFTFSDVGTALAMDQRIKQRQEQQQADAIRWQGAQDYETLVQSGVNPGDALSRTASKLFYNDPQGLAQTARMAQAFNLQQQERERQMQLDKESREHRQNQFALEEKRFEASQAPRASYMTGSGTTITGPATPEQMKEAAAPPKMAEKKDTAPMITVETPWGTVRREATASELAPRFTVEDEKLVEKIAELESEKSKHNYWLNHPKRPDKNYGMMFRSRENRIGEIDSEISKLTDKLSPSGQEKIKQVEGPSRYEQQKAQQGKGDPNSVEFSNLPPINNRPVGEYRHRGRRVWWNGTHLQEMPEQQAPQQ